MQYSRGNGVSSLPAPHPHCRVAVAVSLLILAWWEEHRVGTAFLQHCQDPVVPGEEAWWGPPSVLGLNLHRDGCTTIDVLLVALLSPLSPSSGGSQVLDS